MKRKIENPVEILSDVSLTLKLAVESLYLPTECVRNSQVTSITSKDGDFISCVVNLDPSFCLLVSDLKSFESCFDVLDGFTHGPLMMYFLSGSLFQLTINVYKL